MTKLCWRLTSGLDPEPSFWPVNEASRLVCPKTSETDKARNIDNSKSATKKIFGGRNRADLPGIRLFTINVVPSLDSKDYSYGENLMSTGEAAGLERPLRLQFRQFLRRHSAQ